jgi:hypothetical protein
MQFIQTLILSAKHLVEQTAKLLVTTQFMEQPLQMHIRLNFKVQINLSKKTSVTTHYECSASFAETCQVYVVYNYAGNATIQTIYGNIRHVQNATSYTCNPMPLSKRRSMSMLSVLQPIIAKHTVQ